MQTRVNIGFKQLVELARQLPPAQWKRLKEEVEKQGRHPDMGSDLESFLLSAPVFTKEQLDEIARTRNSIARWREN